MSYRHPFLAIIFLASVFGCNTRDLDTARPGSPIQAETPASTPAADSRQLASSAKGSGSKVADGVEAAAIENHVRIQFPKSHYTFPLSEAAKGIEILYQVVADQDVPDVSPHSSDTGVVEPKELQVFEELYGNGQSYCIRDTGSGPGLRPGWAITVKKGTDSRVFRWDGRNWDGPSDTNRPKGPPFPPGNYTLRVSTVGVQKARNFERSFRIEASVPVTLVK